MATMPKLTGAIKKAPKWAWLSVGGVIIGAVVIRMYEQRATDSTATTDPTTTGSPLTTGSPSPVIVPPVISNVGDQPDLSWLGGIVGGIGDQLGNAIEIIGNLGQGDQELAGSLAGAITGGGAPQPALQVPPVQVIVNPPAAPTPRATPVTTAKCPASFPKQAGAKASPSTCYKCERNTAKGAKYPWIHHYQDGHKVPVKTC